MAARTPTVSAVLLAAACSGGGQAPAPGATEKTEPRRPPAAAPAAPAPAQVTVPPWLAAAVDRGITPPPEGGSTYHVDPFVAALLVEQARAGDLPVEHLADDTAGYRVESPDPNGLLARLGIRDGDVVESINGSSLADPDAIIPALAHSRDRIAVELRREDYSMTLSYRLVGGMGWSRALAAFGAGASPMPTLAPDPGLLPENDEPEPVAAPQAEPGSPSGGGPVTGGGTRPRPDARPPRPRPAPTTRPGGNGSGSRSVRCTSSTQCDIDRAAYDALVQNPKRLESQATLVPAIRNDIQSGYKLKTVRPGTDVHAMGFRSGDKITHINGHFLGDDGQAMALYFKLPATRVFNIRYERGGKRLTKRVQVR